MTCDATARPGKAPGERGDLMELCHDCRTAPAVTHWRTITGPHLCGLCAAMRLDMLSTASPEGR